MTRLGQYDIGDEIGRGGYAAVYRARHVKLQTEVALKVIEPGYARDPETRRRFIQEAQTASALEHPHIIRIFDLAEDQEQVFIAMEYLSGGNLQEWLNSRPPLPWRELMRILGQVAGALDYAHAQGVLHRDVKPTNILMDNKGLARLGDFGLARVAAAPRMTGLGSIVGTAVYLSPEQAEDKELNGRSDQYALGIVAYELLVGQPPFRGDNTTAVSLMHIAQPPPMPSRQNPGVPVEIDEVLLRVLSKQPEARFPSCIEFIRALEAALAASEQRRFRELLAEARELFAKADYETMEDRLKAAAELPLRPDMQEAVAELEGLRIRAEQYQKGVKAWRAAQQQAQNVLDLLPDYPDAEGVFAALKLRPAPPRRLTPKEWAQQILVGASLGAVGITVMLYLAFRWITR